MQRPDAIRVVLDPIARPDELDLMPGAAPGHQITAVSFGFVTIDEVRELEGMKKAAPGRAAGCSGDAASDGA